MDVAVAAVSLLAAVTLTVIVARLLTRLVVTIAELRKITTGLHTLGWALRNLPPPDPSGGRGAAANGRRLGSG